MRAYIILPAALLASCAWSPETRVEEGMYQALNAIDYAQTRSIVRCPERWYEDRSAGMIGEHPSGRAVNAFFAEQAVGHLAVTAVLEHYEVNPWIKRIWQTAGIVVEWQDVAGNRRLGIGLRSGVGSCH